MSLFSSREVSRPKVVIVMAISFKWVGIVII